MNDTNDVYNTRHIVNTILEKHCIQYEKNIVKKNITHDVSY